MGGKKKEKKKKKLTITNLDGTLLTQFRYLILAIRTVWVKINITVRLRTTMVAVRSNKKLTKNYMYSLRRRHLHVLIVYGTYSLSIVLAHAASF